MSFGIWSANLIDEGERNLHGQKQAEKIGQVQAGRRISALGEAIDRIENPATEEIDRSDNRYGDRSNQKNKDGQTFHGRHDFNGHLDRGLEEWLFISSEVMNCNDRPFRTK